MTVLPLKGRSCNVVIPLEYESFTGIELPNGQNRMSLHIKLMGGTMIADIATKSVRKAVAAIAEQGPEALILLIKGRLTPGNIIEGAGLIVQPKTPKAPISEPAT